MNKSDRRFSLFAKPLGRCLETVTKPIYKDYGASAVRLFQDWPKIVGEKLAANCVPETIQFPRQKNRDGTLVIQAESGAALELQHMQPLILERIGMYFGYAAISRLSFKPLVKQTAAKPIRPPGKPRHDLALMAQTVAVQDPDLKAAFEAFAASLSRPT